MFSIQKLIVFAIIIAALWLGFRLVSNMDKKRKAEERQAGRVRSSWFSRFGRRDRVDAPGASRSAASEVELAACPHCGAYVPIGDTKHTCQKPPAA